MRRFIIFFRGKEGTSPLVRLLDSFEGVSMVHQENRRGWEPFDLFNCGLMPTDAVEACLDPLMSANGGDLAQINRIYTRTARRPLAPVDFGDTVGLKMRLKPSDHYTGWPKHRVLARLGRQLRARALTGRYESMMIDLMVRHEVLAFIAVRQDIFRWALSIYHGDGTGKRGHLQFRLASGRVKREEIPRIEVEFDRFERILTKCEATLAGKRALIRRLEERGIRTAPLLYEEFCSDKTTYFRRLFGHLGVDVTDEQIQHALAQGAYFEKVHSEDISEFVINHREVQERYGDCFDDWRA